MRTTSVTAIAIFIASLSDEAQTVASRFPQQAFLCFDTGALPTMFKQVCARVSTNQQKNPQSHGHCGLPVFFPTRAMKRPTVFMRLYFPLHCISLISVRVFRTLSRLVQIFTQSELLSQ